MLIYARSPAAKSGTQDSNVTADSPKQGSVNEMEDTNQPTPPLRALQVLDEINARHAQSCDDYASRSVLTINSVSHAFIRISLDIDDKTLRNGSRSSERGS